MVRKSWTRGTQWQVTQNHRIPSVNRDQVSAKVSMGYSPKKHFADEAVLVDWLLILAFWHLCPHLTRGQREAKTV